MVSYLILKILKRRRVARRTRYKELQSLQTINNTKEEPVCNESCSKCRICLKEGVVSIYTDTVDLSEDLCSFTDIQLNKNDEYPKFLCHNCYSLLQGAILLRKTAQETDKLLRKINAILLPHSKDYHHIEIIPTQTQTMQTEKKYCCKQCNVDFYSYTKYVKHKNLKKHLKYHIKCSICKGVFTSNLYQRHLARHRSENIVCEICGKLFRKDNLIRHQHMHSLKLPFKCQLCPYRSRLIETLKVHIRAHTGDRPYSCGECTASFLTHSNLNRHKLTHRKERPFVCKECGRGFYTKRDVEAHYNIDHVGLKEFACRLCGNKYGTRGSMMKHELRVHKRMKMPRGRVPMYLKDEFKKGRGSSEG